MTIQTIFAFIFTGLLAGFLAGLFGIGGGIVLVPAFWILFPHLGIPQDEAVKLSVGTSLAVITVVTLFTSREHLLKGNLKIKELYWLVFWIIGGVLAGIYLSHIIPGKILKKFFALMLLAVAFKNLLGRREENDKLQVSIKESALIPVTVFFSALLSALLGIGGGVVINSILFSLTKRKVTRIVALSSTVSFLNAFFGCAGYLLVQPQHTIPLQVGYIYLPAAILVSLGALAGSKLGFKVLYKTQSKKLKKWFAVLLIAVAIKILFS